FACADDSDLAARWLVCDSRRRQTTCPATAAAKARAGPTTARARPATAKHSGTTDNAGKEVSSKKFCTSPKWWNWQTHHLEGVAPRGVRVRFPPSAYLEVSENMV